MRKLLISCLASIRLAFLCLLSACLLGPSPLAARADTGDATPVQAAAPTSTPAITPDATLNARPALWVVTRGRATIYLFGTIHLLPKDVAWFGGPLAHAFTTSDTLITEILDPNPDDMRKIVMADAMLPPGTSLPAILPPADRRSLRRILAANGLPADAFDHYQPWYVAVALSTLPLLQKHYDTSDGVDQRLSARAKTLGIRHEALETPAFQLGIFAALPMSVQKHYLHEVMHDLPDVDRDLARMINAWKAGDAARLARLMNEDKSDPQLQTLLLTNRNRTWARWIRQHLDAPGKAGGSGHTTDHVTLFVAVGAGHLAGPDSLITQLAAQGIHARRIQ